MLARTYAAAAAAAVYFAASGPLATWHLALKWVVVLAGLSTLLPCAAHCIQGAGEKLLPVAQHQRLQQHERAVSELYDDRGPLVLFNLERVGIQQVDFGWRLGRYLSSLTGSARQAALALAKQ